MNTHQRLYSSAWIFFSLAMGLSLFRSTTLPSLSMMNFAAKFLQWRSQSGVRQ